MNNNIKKRTIAVLSAATLLFTSGMGMSFTVAKADYLNSVTVVVDEDFEDLNILTRTKGSYSADMVYRMIYDRLLTLDEDGNFVLELIESWTTIPENLYGSAGGESVPYPNIDYAPGWEVQPIFEELFLYEPTDNDIAICTLGEGVEFQNGEALTVDSLIRLVNFAKAQPTDTLIYQTWAPVTITHIDDYTFSLSINTKGFNFGFMDVMYNLASPQGSIVYVDEGGYGGDGYPIGSGAYQLEEVGVSGDFVRFERWDGWWSTETVPTQYVTLKYVSNSEVAEVELLANYASAAVIRDIIYNNGEKLDYWYRYDGSGYFSIEGNPLALFFNTDFRTSVFGHVGYRQAATLALDKDDIRLAGALYEKSNDFWCYLTDDDTADIVEDGGLVYARWWIDEVVGIVYDTEIDIVIYDDNYFSNDTDRQYYIDVCVRVQQYLEILFDYYEDKDVTVNLISASESQMAAYEANGNYDIMLKEIDLHNVNSARNALYGKGSDEINEWLDHAARALDENTYMLMHLAAQYHNYKNYACVTNLGWQRKAVIYNENVSGITRYNGFCPTGDLSTLDFRFIAVTAD